MIRTSLKLLTLGGLLCSQYSFSQVTAVSKSWVSAKTSFPRLYKTVFVSNLGVSRYTATTSYVNMDADTTFGTTGSVPIYAANDLGIFGVTPRFLES